MPTFHFTVRDGSDRPDPVGVDLPNLKAARHHAVAFAGQLLIGDPDAFWSGDDWRMEVTDDRGLILLTLIFVGLDAPAVLR